MQKIILLVIAVVVLAGGYLLFKGDKAIAPTIEDTNTGVESAMPAPGFENSNIPEMIVDETGMVGEPVATIIYTDAGYEPKSVTIKTGQIVRWINKSTSQETWPASAVHPTHGVYPEKTDTDCLGSAFDSCKGLKSGESWDFKFSSVGEWRFHDHLHPSKTGIVIVTE